MIEGERSQRGGSGASRMKKEQFVSVSSGVNIRRDHLQRSKMHTKLRGILKIGVAIGKADEHARSWQKHFVWVPNHFYWYSGTHAWLIQKKLNASVKDVQKAPKRTSTTQAFDGRFSHRVQIRFFRDNSDRLIYKDFKI